MTETEKQFEGFDRVFPIIGGHHLYQWVLLLIVSFQRGVLVFHHIGYIFLGASPDHWCRVDELAEHATKLGWTPAQIRNISIPDGGAEECKYYDLDYARILHRTPRYEDALASLNYTGVETRHCDRWEYDNSTYHSTTVTQFDLVCHRKHLVATIQATYMAGIFVGSLLLGAVSDKLLGRRRTCLLCFCIVIVFGFLTAYASSYTLFVLCRFIIAIGVAGSNQNCFTILMEYSDTKCRAVLGIITQVAFAIFYMLLPLYAYLIRDWSELQLAFSFTSLSLIVYFWILPESSRWLAQNGREEEALDILEKIAKRNGRPKPSRQELKAILDESCQPIPEGSSPTTGGCWNGFKNFLSSYGNLVKTPELRKRSFLIWFLYMTMSFSYYGVSFGSPSLSADPFIIVFLGGLMEIPGYLGSIPLVSYWGRKPTTITTFLVAGLAYLSVVFVPFELKALRITLAMISKLFVSGCSAIIILLAAELYPTENRSTGLGLAVLFGRIGSITAPYVVRAKFDYAETSVVIIGVIAILAAIVGFLLPETKDEEMFEKVNKIEEVVARRRSSVSASDVHALRRQSSTASPTPATRILEEDDVKEKDKDKSVTGNEVHT